MKIGLEIHFQLPTLTKLFCSCPTKASEPNESICPTCLGFPGSRPSLNKKAFTLALMIAKRLQCKIPDVTWFSRKTYFYPDLPKNFQITQYESPLGIDGQFVNNGKIIHIQRVHLEEDPGKIKRVGKPSEEISLIDYNRSGIPLVEIVTAPDISSPKEARDFIAVLLDDIRSLVGISGEDEQSVRVDANISVAEERVEVKNILGLKNLENALEFEYARQSKLIKAGKKVLRETRRYDEERKVTLPAREKEFEEDYGYILEPDLGVFNIKELAETLVLCETPLMRAERISREFELPFEKAKIIGKSPVLASIFQEAVAKFSKQEVLTLLFEQIIPNWSSFEKRITDDAVGKLGEIIEAILSGALPSADGRRMLVSYLRGTEFMQGGTDFDREKIVEQVDAIIRKRPEVLRDYAENKRAANFIVGQLMKIYRGKIPSEEIAKIVFEEMDKRASQ
ncbi:MAG: Asp-tRNA(Asn)/Glu-tRNA(Gln) amidotransferase subunit GatB [Methanomassiliicoccales archaeon]